jgi:hypothetical protein
MNLGQANAGSGAYPRGGETRHNKDSGNAQVAVARRRPAPAHGKISIWAMMLLGFADLGVVERHLKPNQVPQNVRKTRSPV